MTAYIPKTLKDKICCSIDFRKHNIKGITIVLNQDELLKDFFGSEDEFVEKHCTPQLNDKDEVFIELGNVQMIINSNTCYHLYKQFEELQEKYIKAIKKMEDIYGANGLEKVDEGYKIATLSRSQYKAFCTFIEKHNADYSQKIDENSIFSNMSSDYLYLKPIELYPVAEQDYADVFVKYDEYVLTDDMQNMILDGLIENDHSELINEFRYLIFGSDREVDNEDYSGLRLAKRSKNDFRKWIETHKPLEIDEGNMIASWFVAMVQEILYCKRNRIKIKNGAFGIKEGRRTLTAALKSPESAQAKEIQAWLIRLENRYSADIGSHNFQAVREIEKLFVKIRRKTLDYHFHNWEDLEFVDEALVHMVERIILPRSLAETKLARLADSIGKTINNIKLVHYAGMKQQWDLGRELAYDDTAITRMTREIEMRAKECPLDMCDDGYLYNQFLFEFPIYYGDGTEKRFKTGIVFNRNDLAFILFREIVSGEKASQYKSYGLEKFIIL